MDEAKGKDVIQKMVNEWSKVFTNQVFFNNVEGNVWCYSVEFSIPKEVKPIPEGTVKCDFYLTELPDGGHEIEFNFENESLRHRVDNTMRSSMYESWIDRLLEKKLTVKSKIHLGTEFEKSRFVNEKGE